MKNILLAICGLSPQVITEALYALWHEGREVHSIHVITTRPGKDRLLSGLLAPEDGKYHALLADNHIAPGTIDFSARNIHTLKNTSGIEIDDIISAEDNEILMKTCLELTFRHTRGDDTAVFFLVAGGRKTMTSCLTLAAQLYGRPQDRILHVLVSPEFENCRDFWFPPRRPVLIQLHDHRGQPYLKESRYAEIELITIPFVSVREQLRQDLLDHPRHPAELMQSLIRDTPRTLTIRLAEGKLVYGRSEMDMHPARLAVYAFFVEQKKNCTRNQSCQGCTECFLEVSEIDGNAGIGRMYERIPGARMLEEMHGKGISSLSKEDFRSYRTKIRNDILEKFGQAHITELEISSHGKRPDKRYGIRLDRGQIRLEW